MLIYIGPGFLDGNLTISTKILYASTFQPGIPFLEISPRELYAHVHKEEYKRIFIVACL